MDDLIGLFRERGDRYIDQCDALYAYLVEPFILLKQTKQNVGAKDEIPKPSFLRSESPVSEEALPQELFSL
jgi:hypothetical protein